MKICICLAHNYPAFQREFIVSVFRMQEFFYKSEEANKHELSFIVRGGYSLDKMRNKVVEDALEFKQDLLLFLDTDMSFQPEMIVRMIKVMEANKCDAVTGVYTWKKPPYLPQLFDKFSKRTNSFPIIQGFPMNRTFFVGGAGMGCIMIKAEVFKRNKKPWFKFVEKGESKVLKRGCGEDLYFFWKCKPKTVCDPTIQAGHYDTRPVSLNNYITKNGLEVKDNRITGDKKVFKRIAKEHLRLAE